MKRDAPTVSGFIVVLALAALCNATCSRAASVVVNLAAGAAIDLQNVTLMVGDTLTWMNEEFSPPFGRDVQSYSGEWQSPILTNQGASFAYTFNRPGMFTYRSYIYDISDPGNYRLRCCVVPGTVTVLPWSNSPPAVTINHPIEGFHFIASEHVGSQFDRRPFPVLASVNNDPTNIDQVEFYAGTNCLGAATNVPFQLDVIITNAGPYTLTARVIEKTGLTPVSRPVNILVRPRLTYEVYRPRRLFNGVFLLDYAAYSPFPRICMGRSEDLQQWIEWSPLITTTFGTFVDEYSTNAPIGFYAIVPCP